MVAEPQSDAILTGVARPAALPRYLTLARGFERQLRAGTFRVGDRLPSVRQLRRDHRISAATAVSCYLWLERQGYVRARAKSGYYVGRLPGAESPSPVPETAARSTRPVIVGPELALGLQIPPAINGSVLDLGPAVISAALLPVNRLNRSVRAALSAFEDSVAQYEEARGAQRLRRQIARLMFRQGTECKPDDIIVTAGATEALSLAIRATTEPGDVVAVESPGCFEMLRGLEAMRLRALEIPHRAGGIDLDLLRVAVRRHRVKAVMLNATCHNPIGDCATDAVKAEIARFADRHRIAVIESDTFGDLVFSGVRPRTVKSFDTGGRVLQCASLAHFVAPGFNIGWISAGRYQKAVEQLKQVTNLGGSRLNQLALAEFLESGAFDRHVRHLRAELWRTVESARQDVLRHFPAGTRVSQPEGGFVLWIQLPEGHDGEAVRRRAAAAGIHILSGSVFSPNRLYRPYIRIACGYPYDVLKPAIRTVAALAQRASH
jgi:DNA-binding transcriptional MocR family regulator